MKRRTFWSAALATAALATMGTAVFAQGPPPGGPGGFGGPRGFGGPGGPGGGGAQFLLMMPEVQQELKLDAAQIDLLQALRPAGPGGPGGGGGRQSFEELQKLSPEERQQRFAAMRQQEDKKIAEILDAKQVARLKQLQLQQSGARALGQPEIADALKLTAAQKLQVQTALQSERDGMRALFQSGQNDVPPSDDQRQAVMKKMQELRSGVDSKLNAVLTDSQKQQFKSMQGAAFTFPQPRFGGPGGPGGPGGFGGQRPQRQNGQ